ncbi:MAG: DUF4159 domain-containing protein [Phycisphaeraceae bacterium]
MRQHKSHQTSRTGSFNTWLAAALAVLLAATPLLAQDRQLGTVGPPPRQDPQRETAAEGLPPLPLPAVPLRRSEPKAEPSPPVFVARLAYGDSQDYMPNPGDIDNLLRHVRHQIDAWYGHTVLSLDELAQQQADGQPVRIPVLYMSGYEAFTFTEPQREALREYLLDGGTLLAEATLGSPAFTAAFQQEMQQIFPQRKLDTLQVDHPAFRGYYQYDNVNYFTINDGTHSRFESPPQMLGINIAARTAVILSPYDLSCGWDEFYAPPAPRRGDRQPEPTMAMLPGDAIRMGINLVAYISANRNFAQAQAYTQPIEGTQQQHRAAVRLGLLRHQGDWNPDPNSLYQLIRLAALRTSVPVAYELEAVDPEPAALIDTPILIMTGMSEPNLDDAGVTALRRHLQAGGFLFINNTSGYAKFDREARALIAQLAPDHDLERLPADHDLFSTLYDIEQMRDAGTQQPREPHVEAVTLNNRVAIIYSPNDTLAMLKGIHDPYANAYDADSARQLALNILCYALQQ